MKHFSSIYSRRREPKRPVYRKVSWLDVLRAERKADATSAAAERIMLDALLYGTGIGLAHVPLDRAFASMPETSEG